MWPAFPTVHTDDIDFKTLVAFLGDRHIAVLAGNPSHIQGPSPLKRVGDVGHAIALRRACQRKAGLEILVDDPFRPGGKHLRGEWVPAKQVRQFAFRDSDSTLTAVWAERYGAWTAESLARNRRQADRPDRATPVGPHRGARGRHPGRLPIRHRGSARRAGQTSPQAAEAA